MPVFGPAECGAFLFPTAIVRFKEHMSSLAAHLSASLRSIEYKSWEWEPPMRALIARQIYQPAVVLPLLLLMRLMVTLDFNLAQVMFVMLLRGSQHAYQFVARQAVHRERGQAIERIACRHCC
jgi:hypothetical protein